MIRSFPGLVKGFAMLPRIPCLTQDMPAPKILGFLCQGAVW